LVAFPTVGLTATEVEQDTEEAFEKGRELVKLLVERNALGRNEDGRTKSDSPTDSGRLPPQWGGA